MFDIEEDIEYQRYFKERYDSLRQGEYKYGMDIMGILYYQSIPNTCIDLLSMILDECINYQTIYTKDKGLHKTGKINRDYRYNKLVKSGYINITKDGYIIPNVSKKHLDKCYYQDIQTERKEEGV